VIAGRSGRRRAHHAPFCKLFSHTPELFIGARDLFVGVRELFIGARD
jgi:hypothetical protein